ncbi:MAG TPA: sugar ABC transporter ATP-binding protein [Rectinemataceae bacterium]|nr:sugar ABC transporter ATP-binding protein [Rectinemataceae bacterium]
MDSNILEMRGISMYFPGIKALDDVDLSVRPGEVHALIGENGAGKSTLVKVLTGLYKPTAGRIAFEGSERKFSSTVEAQLTGIVAIHQEPIMFPDLSVAENVFSGHMLRKRGTGLLDWPGMRTRTRELCARIELDANPDSMVSELSVAQRHMVGIARALSMNARLLIMDEPTSALSIRETEDLFKIIRQLRAEGTAILFISHKFDELFAIADSYTVLRDGKLVGTGLMEDATVDSLVTLMAGRSLGQMFPKRRAEIGEEILKLRGFSSGRSFKDVSFSLRRGEILGFFGLVGAGRSEIMKSLLGLDPLDSGEIFLDGRKVRFSGPSAALSHGLAYVPEDRQAQGLVLPLSIANNICLPQTAALAKAGFIAKKKEARLSREYGSKMEIRAAGWDMEAMNLSGGNQQKVVLAKWLATKPRILILDEPTKGIDVGTKAAVHEFMSNLAAEGLAIIMISSELPEILGMSDRVAVMHEGELVAIMDRADASEDKILKAATGASGEEA